MKTKYSLLFSCLSCLSLFTFPLSADSMEEDFANESYQEHVSVETRPMDQSKREQMQKTQEEQCVEQKSAQCNKPSKLKHSEKNARFFNSYQPKTIHWLTNTSYSGTQLELEDGSYWKIPSDVFSTYNWKIGDPLVVTPNRSWFSHYKYYLVNQITGGYVPADIYVGPGLSNPYRHWIIAIDYALGHIFLENGTAWAISGNDGFVASDWMINDSVIIGANDSWFSGYDSILINVQMNNYVRAYQY